MRLRLARIPVLLATALSLTGCYTVAPRVVTEYDDDCEIGFRKMVLTAEQQGLFIESCGGSECAAGILSGLLWTSLTTVVSGSIVLVGNTVFWMEKQGRCDVKETKAVEG